MIKKAKFNTKIDPSVVMDVIMPKIELLDVSMYTQYNLTEKDITLLYYIYILQFMATNNNLYKANAKIIKDTYLSSSRCNLEEIIMSELDYINNSVLDKGGKIIVAPKECIVLKDKLSYGFKDGMLGMAIRLLEKQYKILSNIEKVVNEGVLA